MISDTPDRSPAAEYDVTFLPITKVWALTCNGYTLTKRIKRFKRSWWKTEAGARSAARVLNTEAKARALALAFKGRPYLASGGGYSD
jgi:hypothetical protein